jgi:REP element-mobilizing transposase RayT
MFYQATQKAARTYFFSTVFSLWLPMSFYQRNLPHWHPEGAALFLTWRLHGSLPRSSQAPLEPPRQQTTAGRAFRSWEAVLDAAGAGPTWLNQPRVASVVVSTLRRGASEQRLYRWAAFVVMPNHVHVLREPWAAVPRITQWIKGNAAREANRVLGRSGVLFWQHESYDRWVRNDHEYQRIVRYLEFNPAAVGLTTAIEHWPWSSASVGPASVARQ